MDICTFFNKLNLLKEIDLEGEKSHNIFSKNLRKSMSFYDMARIKPKQSSVLLLFFERNKKIMLLLEQRNIYKGFHSGQICLVGGKRDENDKNIEFTAIREAEEETGISKNSISIIKNLSPVYIPPSNFLIFPFIAFTNTKNPNFINKDNEVSEFLEINIYNLLDDNNIKEVEIETNYFGKKKVLAFVINQKIIWGATAMILQEFKDLFLKIKL